MELALRLAIGFAGSMMCVALALLLFEERSPFDVRPPYDGVGLLVCLLFNVTGWIIAVVAA